MRRLSYTISIWLLIGLFLSACSSTTLNLAPAPSSAYAVDPLFRDTYNYLSAIDNREEHLFGPPITTVYTQEGLKKQFFRNVQLVYDPNASPEQRFSLAPLGRQLGYYEPSGIVMPKTGDLVVDGYVIFSPFTQMYQELGPQIVGRPLTGPRLHPDYNRLEQHFENMGFYVRMDDPSRQVHLLQYGLASCGPPCQTQYAPLEGAVNGAAGISEPFASAVTRLTTAMLGNFIAGPYQGADGNYEIIFENMVLYAIDNRVIARPTALLIDTEPTAPVTQLETPYVIFLPTVGNLGHNVPVFLDEYIVNHGGYEISGTPINEFFEMRHNVYRQCFTNLCLDFYTAAPEAFQIQPAPLGAQYYEMYYNNLSISPQEKPTSEQYNIMMQVTEQKTLISSQENQVIYAAIFNHGKPMENVQLTLTVSLPNGTPISFAMPLTNGQGTTSASIAAITAINGTLIPYNVCLEHPIIGSRCVSESYLIWFNPQ